MILPEVWQLLQEVKDPEMPVVSITELGIVRAVNIHEGRVTVTLTPTFTSCPAYQFMASAVEQRLRKAGVEDVQVQTVLDPPWSTDWISDEGRAKLKEFGIAIGPPHGGNLSAAMNGPVGCPYCGSTRTEVKNPFGTTRCRSICFCHGCTQPFEWIKPL